MKDSSVLISNVTSTGILNSSRGFFRVDEQDPSRVSHSVSDSSNCKILEGETEIKQLRQTRTSVNSYRRVLTINPVVRVTVATQTQFSPKRGHKGFNV